MTRHAAPRLALLLGMITVLAACASLTTPMDPPNVSLESFSGLPSDGGGPRFLIKLRVQNPNEQKLDIAGISYTIDLMGKEVITGVSNEVPVIEGYGEGVVSLEASLNLFQMLRLLADLGQAEPDKLTYRFAAKIDFRGLVPTQRIEEEGLIGLGELVQPALGRRTTRAIERGQADRVSRAGTG